MNVRKPIWLYCTYCLCARNCTNGIFISVLAVTVTYDRYTCILLASQYEVFFINSYNQDYFSSSYKNISSSSPVNSDHTSAKHIRNIFKSCVCNISIEHEFSFQYIVRECKVISLNAFANEDLDHNSQTVKRHLYQIVIITLYIAIARKHFEHLRNITLSLYKFDVFYIFQFIIYLSKAIDIISLRK